MKKFAAALCVLCFILSAKSSNAQTSVTPSEGIGAHAIDPAKEADIRHLMEVVGTRKLMNDTLALSEQNMRPVLIHSLPPGDYRDRLVDLFFQKFHAKLNLDDMIAQAFIAYDKYLSDDDIKGLIQFYQTPLGQKTLTVLPKLTAELQGYGVKMGEKAGQDSMQEVLAEHPEFVTEIQEAAQKARANQPEPPQQ